MNNEKQPDSPPKMGRGSSGSILISSNNKTPICGVYIILHKDSGRVYVGSSVDIYSRCHVHSSALNKNKHGNSYLQSVWNKYGPHAFEFKLVHVCSRDEMVKSECAIMNNFGSLERCNGFNFRHPVTLRHSEETKKRIADGRRGKSIKMPPRRPEHTEKLRLANLGRKLTEEHKSNIRLHATRGEDSGTCKYPDSICRRALELMKTGMRPYMAAKTLGIPADLANRVRRGQRKFASA